MPKHIAEHPLKVFLCHAHSDRETVRAVYHRLIEDGVDAWLDKEKLLPGQDWEMEIRKAVRESDVVVVCLSTQFNQAGFRQKEVRLALDTAMEKPEGEIFIIPARLDDCDALESLRKWHWVDLFEEDGYEMLLRALRARADTMRSGAGEKSSVSHAAVPSRSKTPVQRSADKPKAADAAPRKLNPAVIVALIGLVGTVLAALISSPLLETLLTRTPVPTSVVSISTETSVPVRVETSTSTVTPEPTAVADDIPMILIPAGEFTMGSANGAPDELPVHQVYLDAFTMDQYEVTNARYKSCVDAGACTSPRQTDSYTHSSYYGNPQFDEYPVIYVDWAQAATYCEWRGGSLPTEAQWEKAARGTDERTYPWGDVFDGTKLNFCDQECPLEWADKNVGDGYADTAPVGSYESGKSPYGIYDLAGNVWEWTADWYDAATYASGSSSNPQGPDSGQYRVLRGGAWYFVEANLRSPNRGNSEPNHISEGTGFRCVKSVTP